MSTLARFDSSVMDNTPRPVPGALVYVYTQPISGWTYDPVTGDNTWTPNVEGLASIFSDNAGADALANPFQIGSQSLPSDSSFYFYAAQGSYTVVIAGSTLAAPYILIDQAIGTPAAGVTLETNGSPNSSQALLNIIGADGITASESGGTVTVRGSGSGITLETNSETNGDQTLLNLENGTDISITQDGEGNVTISSTGGASFEVNGTPNEDQSLLNLQAGTNVTITDEGSGEVEISAAWPEFEVNGSAVTTQSPLNFISSTNIQATNPSTGEIQFNAIGVEVEADWQSIRTAETLVAAASATVIDVNFTGGGFADNNYTAVVSLEDEGASGSPPDANPFAAAISYMFSKQAAGAGIIVTVYNTDPSNSHYVTVHVLARHD